MDIRSVQALSGYAAAPQAKPDADPSGLAQAAQDFMATLQKGEAEAARAVTGDGNPHDLVTALAESQMAISATVAVRDKVVEAYQELLRMPV
ncbi:flagellar hook-basal body complex protein FliE [Jannaschia sp. LMIT008]|uniref:flagellar hook-basal body complex protein FliE n=1 Tax=Jannaschia maritima TaxID=3032585 RepID=UPI002810AB7B|nr:flagellar hook-basal body complex protein FliE [Jannaschia sp. LMIT008]